MTKRLFDTDSHLLAFSARVLSCEARGEEYGVILDETAFAPEGGGQPSDLGLIGGVTVTNVIEENGEIVHLLSTALPVGEEVACELDGDRRLRHIQNHTAEHIVSGLFYREYGMNNVGFHLGHEDVTLDLDGTVDVGMLRRIELLANVVVAENRAVCAYYPEKDELATLFYRSKGEIDGAVRVVEIEGVDACACCVPHVKRTGEIGGIRLVSFMRYKGGTRIHMVAGLDALRVSVSDREILNEIGNLLSLPTERIFEGVKKLHEDLGLLKYALEAQKREKVRLLLEKEQCLFIEKGLEVSHLRTLAVGMSEKTGKAVAAFGGEDEKGYAFVLVAPDDFEKTASSICETLHAKGGGKAPILQGTAACTEAEIRAFFKE